MKGFTLIEFMIVAAIIGIIAAIAIPAFNNSKKPVEQDTRTTRAAPAECIRVEGRLFCEKK